jgi:hypothetical protein
MAMFRALILPPLFLLAACAGPAPPDRRAEGGDCFNVGQISGFSELEGPAVRVKTSVDRSYDLELSGPSCDDVSWAQAIAIDAAPSRWICVGNIPVQGRVRFRDPASRRVTSCQITRVSRAVPAAGSAKPR